MSLEVEIRHRLGDFLLDASFDAPPGLTVLYGRSGAGKSSIVAAIAGLLRPDTGRVALGGEVLLDTRAGVYRPAHRRRIGCVFQDGRLFPHLSVRANLLYGHWFRSGIRAGVGAPPADFDRLVSMLGLEPLLARGVSALSGGERQRVALGRALLSKPRLLIADEPLAALDAARKAEILPYFERLRDEVGIPIIHVSHDAGEVARLATTVVVIEAGRVVAQGAPADILADPEHLPAGEADLAAVLEARVVACHADGLTELDAGGVPLFLVGLAHPVGTRVRVRVRAADVMIACGDPSGLSALNRLSATIEAIEPAVGAAVRVRLRTPAGPIPALITRRSAQALGLTQGLACHAVIKTLAIAHQIEVG